MTKAITLLTKTTTTQTEDALSYYRVRGLYFLAVVFATTILLILLAIIDLLASREIIPNP